MTTLTAISFIAIRKAAFQFIQSIIVGSRILFLIPLIALGAISIFGAVGISFVLALLAALVLLVRSGVRPGLVIDRGFLGEAFHFGSLVICVTHISLMNKVNEKHLNYSDFLLFSKHHSYL